MNDLSLTLNQEKKKNMIFFRKANSKDNTHSSINRSHNSNTPQNGSKNIMKGSNERDEFFGDFFKKKKTVQEANKQ